MNEQGQSVLSTKALAAVRRVNMLREGDNVLAALSGGADSMALLMFLWKNREELKLGSLSAVHINHGLRGEEADRDEQFVREQCSYFGIPLAVYHADVKAEAAKSGEGLEEAGRRIRYRYFCEQAVQQNACVATAHTLSDSMETVLFHMARGCGLRGLCGIPPIREYQQDGNRIKIIRPLIDCTRSDIETYCEQNTIPYIQDSTNTDTTYARNRIRHCIVPELRKLNAGVEDTFRRLMRHAQEDEAYLNGLAENALHQAELTDGRGGYDADRLAGLPPALRVRVLDRAVQTSADYNCSEAQLGIMERLLVKSGAVQLSPDIRVRVSQGRLAVLTREQQAAEPQEDLKISLVPGISCTFYGRIYMPRLFTLENYEKEKKIHKNLLKNALNYDKITGNLFLRTRRPGDFYRPAGRGLTKTIKKLFGEAKLPAEQRDTVGLVCDDKGIVLVEDFGCDERVQVDNSTRRVLVLELENCRFSKIGRQN